jgi:hypothetical protein
MGTMSGTSYKLKRFASTNNHLRTKEIVGTFIEPPTEGNCFSIFADALDSSHEDYFRCVKTSRVLRVQRVDGGWQFRTLNSVYSLMEV